jgi:hypothetical protein
MKMRWQAFSLVVALTAAWNVAEAQNVKVTPIGQRTGEFCAGDRAILFEDPTGARLLYDPGNTVAGAGDPRLGNDVHAILISHAHSEHLVKRQVEPESRFANLDLWQHIAYTGAKQQHCRNRSGQKLCDRCWRPFGDRPRAINRRSHRLQYRRVPNGWFD